MKPPGPYTDPLIQAIVSTKTALDAMSLLLVDRLSTTPPKRTSDRDQLLECAVGELARAVVKIKSIEGGENTYRKVMENLKEQIFS